MPPELSQDPGRLVLYQLQWHTASTYCIDISRKVGTRRDTQLDLFQS